MENSNESHPLTWSHLQRLDLVQKDRKKELVSGLAYDHDGLPKIAAVHSLNQQSSTNNPHEISEKQRIPDANVVVIKSEKVEVLETGCAFSTESDSSKEHMCSTSDPPVPMCPTSARNKELQRCSSATLHSTLAQTQTSNQTLYQTPPQTQTLNQTLYQTPPQCCTQKSVVCSVPDTSSSKFNPGISLSTNAPVHELSSSSRTNSSLTRSLSTPSHCTTGKDRSTPAELDDYFRAIEPNANVVGLNDFLDFFDRLTSSKDTPKDQTVESFPKGTRTSTEETPSSHNSAAPVGSRRASDFKLTQKNQPNSCVSSISTVSHSRTGISTTSNLHLTTDQGPQGNSTVENDKHSHISRSCIRSPNLSTFGGSQTTIQTVPTLAPPVSGIPLQKQNSISGLQADPENTNQHSVPQRKNSLSQAGAETVNNLNQVSGVKWQSSVSRTETQNVIDANQLSNAQGQNSISKKESNELKNTCQPPSNQRQNSILGLEAEKTSNPDQFSPDWKQDLGSRAKADLANDANRLSAALRGSSISGMDAELVSNMDKLANAQRMCSVSGTGACPLNNTNQFSATVSLTHPELPHEDSLEASSADSGKKRNQQHDSLTENRPAPFQPLISTSEQQPLTAYPQTLQQVRNRIQQQKQQEQCSSLCIRTSTDDSQKEKLFRAQNPDHAIERGSLESRMSLNQNDMEQNCAPLSNTIEAHHSSYPSSALNSLVVQTGTTGIAQETSRSRTLQNQLNCGHGDPANVDQMGSIVSKDSDDGGDEVQITRTVTPRVFRRKQLRQQTNTVVIKTEKLPDECASAVSKTNTFVIKTEKVPSECPSTDSVPASVQSLVHANPPDLDFESHCSSNCSDQRRFNQARTSAVVASSARLGSERSPESLPGLFVHAETADKETSSHSSVVPSHDPVNTGSASSSSVVSSHQNRLDQVNLSSVPTSPPRQDEEVSSIEVPSLSVSGINNSRLQQLLLTKKQAEDTLVNVRKEVALQVDQELRNLSSLINELGIWDILGLRVVEKSNKSSDSNISVDDKYKNSAKQDVMYRMKGEKSEVPTCSSYSMNTCPIAKDDTKSRHHNDLQLTRSEECHTEQVMCSEIKEGIRKEIEQEHEPVHCKSPESDVFIGSWVPPDFSFDSEQSAACAKSKNFTASTDEKGVTAFASQCTIEQCNSVDKQHSTEETGLPRSEDIAIKYTELNVEPDKFSEVGVSDDTVNKEPFAETGALQSKVAVVILHKSDGPSERSKSPEPTTNSKIVNVEISTNNAETSTEQIDTVVLSTNIKTEPCNTVDKDDSSADKKSLAGLGLIRSALQKFIKTNKSTLDNISTNLDKGLFKIKTEPISDDSSMSQKIEDSGDIVQPTKIQTSDQATFPREMCHDLIAETTPLTSARESVAETTPLTSARESVAETTPLTSARESVAETTPLTSARESVAETAPLTCARESVAETTPLTSARESVNKSVESNIDTLSACINRTDKLDEKVHARLTKYEDFDGSCFGDPSLQDMPLHSKGKVRPPRSLQILENATKVKTKKTINKRFRKFMRKMEEKRERQLVQTKNENLLALNLQPTEDTLPIENFFSKAGLNSPARASEDTFIMPPECSEKEFEPLSEGPITKETVNSSLFDQAFAASAPPSSPNTKEMCLEQKQSSPSSLKITVDFDVISAGRGRISGRQNVIATMEKEESANEHSGLHSSIEVSQKNLHGLQPMQKLKNIDQGSQKPIHFIKKAKEDQSLQNMNTDACPKEQKNSHERSQMVKEKKTDKVDNNKKKIITAADMFSDKPFRPRLEQKHKESKNEQHCDVQELKSKSSKAFLISSSEGTNIIGQTKERESRGLYSEDSSEKGLKEAACKERDQQDSSKCSGSDKKGYQVPERQKPDDTQVSKPKHQWKTPVKAASNKQEDKKSITANITPSKTAGGYADTLSDGQGENGKRSKRDQKTVKMTDKTQKTLKKQIVSSAPLQNRVKESKEMPASNVQHERGGSSDAEPKCSPFKVKGIYSGIQHRNDHPIVRTRNTVKSASKHQNKSGGGMNIVSKSEQVKSVNKKSLSENMGTPKDSKMDRTDEKNITVHCTAPKAKQNTSTHKETQGKSRLMFPDHSVIDITSCKISDQSSKGVKISTANSSDIKSDRKQQINSIAVESPLPVSTKDRLSSPENVDSKKTDLNLASPSENVPPSPSKRKFVCDSQDIRAVLRNSQQQQKVTTTITSPAALKSNMKISADNVGTDVSKRGRKPSLTENMTGAQQKFKEKVKVNQDSQKVAVCLSHSSPTLGCLKFSPSRQMPSSEEKTRVKRTEVIDRNEAFRSDSTSHKNEIGCTKTSCLDEGEKPCSDQRKHERHQKKASSADKETNSIELQWRFSSELRLQKKNGKQVAENSESQDCFQRPKGKTSSPCNEASRNNEEESRDNFPESLRKRPHDCTELNEDLKRQRVCLSTNSTCIPEHTPIHRNNVEEQGTSGKENVVAEHSDMSASFLKTSLQKKQEISSDKQHCHQKTRQEEYKQRHSKGDRVEVNIMDKGKSHGHSMNQQDIAKTKEEMLAILDKYIEIPPTQKPVMRVSPIVRKLQTGEQGNEEDSKDTNDRSNTSERDSVNMYVSGKVTEKSSDSVKAVISDFLAEGDIFKDDRGCRTVLYPIKDSFKVKDDSLKEISDISTQKDNTQKSSMQMNVSNDLKTETIGSTDACLTHLLVASELDTKTAKVTTPTTKLQITVQGKVDVDGDKREETCGRSDGRKDFQKYIKKEFKEGYVSAQLNHLDKLDVNNKNGIYGYKKSENEKDSREQCSRRGSSENLKYHINHSTNAEGQIDTITESTIFCKEDTKEFKAKVGTYPESRNTEQSNSKRKRGRSCSPENDRGKPKHQRSSQCSNKENREKDYHDYENDHHRTTNVMTSGQSKDEPMDPCQTMDSRVRRNDKSNCKNYDPVENEMSTADSVDDKYLSDACYDSFYNPVSRTKEEEHKFKRIYSQDYEHKSKISIDLRRKPDSFIKDRDNRRSTEVVNRSMDSHKDYKDVAIRDSCRDDTAKRIRVEREDSHGDDVSKRIRVKREDSNNDFQTRNFEPERWRKNSFDQNYRYGNRIEDNSPPSIRRTDYQHGKVGHQGRQRSERYQRGFSRNYSPKSRWENSTYESDRHGSDRDPREKRLPSLMNSESWRDQRQNIDNEYYRRESMREHEIYINYDHQHVRQERFPRGFRPHRDVGDGLSPWKNRHDDFEEGQLYRVPPSENHERIEMRGGNFARGYSEQGEYGLRYQTVLHNRGTDRFGGPPTK